MDCQKIDSKILLAEISEDDKIYFIEMLDIAKKINMLTSKISDSIMMGHKNIEINNNAYNNLNAIKIAAENSSDISDIRRITTSAEFVNKVSVSSSRKIVEISKDINEDTDNLINLANYIKQYGIKISQDSSLLSYKSKDSLKNVLEIYKESEKNEFSKAVQVTKNMDLAEEMVDQKICVEISKSAKKAFNIAESANILHLLKNKETKKN